MPVSYNVNNNKTKYITPTLSSICRAEYPTFVNQTLFLTLNALHKYTAISRNVVWENDECQLSNGDFTTEKNCGY